MSHETEIIPLSEAEEAVFWPLYVRALESGRLTKRTTEYCPYCRDFFSLPEQGQQNNHWRWQKPSGKTKVGRFQCKVKDQEYRNKYNSTRRNTVDGFLIRKWDIVQTRCNKPQPSHMGYKGKLVMTKEEFYAWGKPSLEDFIQKKNLDNIYYAGIQLDRIDNTKPYQVDNLQWLLREDHQKKTLVEMYPHLKGRPEYEIKTEEGDDL